MEKFTIMEKNGKVYNYGKNGKSHNYKKGKSHNYRKGKVTIMKKNGKSHNYRKEWKKSQLQKEMVVVVY